MQFFATCYTRLQGRRGLLILLLAALLLLCCWNLTRLTIEDSIAVMLPDGGSSVAEDFQLLQQAPFARKVVIHLRAVDTADAEVLDAATEDLLRGLPEPWFVHAVAGPNRVNPGRLIGGLLEVLPLLLDEEDLNALAGRLDDEGITETLATILGELHQPQGMLIRERISRDPFALHQRALKQVLRLNPLPEVRLEGGKFVSRDGLSRLILADTPVPVTDADGARRLLESFDLARSRLPVGVTAELISGHAYTLANAEVIKSDMGKVLLVSGGGLLLLFVLVIGRIRAIPVLLLPLFSMLIAVQAVSWRFDQVSGITIGFGAVLLGITIDFALHVYFALVGRRQGRPEILRLVARPVLFGGLTSVAAFTVLIFSDLPGQRQLGLFAAVGIVAAVLLALLVLPHFVPQGQQATAPSPLNGKRPLLVRRPWLRTLVIIGWAGLCLVGLWSLPQLTMNGELRQLGYLPTRLVDAEGQLSRIWGDVRGRALIFVMGDDFETLLQRNEEVYRVLVEQGFADEAVSLAPVLFSAHTARQRLASWDRFWDEHRAATQEKFARIGAGYGFSAGAFAPFFDGLRKEPPSLDRLLLDHWGLGGVVDTLLQENDGGYRLITLIPDRPEQLSVLDEKGILPAGAVLVSQTRFGRQLGEVIGADFFRFLSIAALVVVILLGLLFRRATLVLLALLPAATGVILMLAGMTWLGIELNLFNVIASLLVIGLGVDYGIFMACHSGSRFDPAPVRAVVVSGLSTLIGFGALTLAQHPALYSIGLTLLLGIGAAMPTAVLVIPALRRQSL